MALGSVLVNNGNLLQGGFPAVERVALIIGEGATGVGEFKALSATSDLDVELGIDDSEIKTNVKTAQLNGGAQWFAYVSPQANGYDFAAVLGDAMTAGIDPEFVGLCTPATTKEELEAAYTLAEGYRASHARRFSVWIATPGINPATQTWSDYLAAQAAITSGVAAERIAAVPQLHGNDLGAVLGRLCDHSVSIADSPMRVITGPVLGLGDIPLDSDGVALDHAHRVALDVSRLSVSQTYRSYPGVYWADGMLLDVPGGDYLIIENLRIVDKAARAVRILSIGRIADRLLNSTPESIKNHQTFFAKVLREMNRAGEIKPPKSSDITIKWITNRKVEIYIKATPFESAKEIVAVVYLDLDDLA